ncbi:two-component sensor histidine kinase [Luteimonas sp. Y-2-2-4F]|nr:ATP-binding protein [Luteimonas sp. Y-2-2-4F]MCD9032115.1 two-component sensor histidine kinase [Luteimonas sp. Y-2-2-4F]
MPPIRAQRPAAVAAISAGLVLLAVSHAQYGLAAQSGSIMLSILPLLFAGLLLGRAGLWATAAAYLGIVGLGAWADLQRDAAGLVHGRDLLSNLLQPVLACAIVALILDRLILKSDVSERRSRELAQAYRRLEIEIREKERSQAQLLHSQRIDALGKLASNIAHDFNNLLAVVLGYAQRGARTPGCPEEARHCLERIDATARRGGRLTGKLLTLARNDAAVRETFDANEVLLELEPILRSLLGPGVAVETAPSPEPAWLRMDRTEFEAGIVNIAKNAGDAMPAGGRFLLAVETGEDEVRLRLEDSGHGMPPQTLARIFEPFFTTKPRERGSGIGLAMVSRIVTEAGGRIEADSAPDRGTRFTLRLPPAPAEDSP